MFLSDANAMSDLGAKLYQSCQQGGIIFLQGNLGVGKTTLVRGFLQAAAISQSVRSPTYTLMEHYETQKLNVIHMDLYRLSEPDELEYLAVREFINKQTLFFIEWPDKAQGFFKKVDLQINIDYHEGGRELSFDAQSEMGKALVLDLA